MALANATDKESAHAVFSRKTYATLNNKLLLRASAHREGGDDDKYRH
jgi:hypothetical protein